MAYQIAQEAAAAGRKRMQAALDREADAAADRSRQKQTGFAEQEQPLSCRYLGHCCATLAEAPGSRGSGPLASMDMAIVMCCFCKEHLLGSVSANCHLVL
jgi:hypothetical protein